MLTSRLFVCLLALPLMVMGQRRFDITPLYGYSSSITFPVKDGAGQEAEAKVGHSDNFAFAAGVRYDEEQVIEFRYMRQSSQLTFDRPVGPVPQFSSGARLEHFLGDFTHEFVFDNYTSVRPFLTASLGMARVTASGQSYNRFAFGVGGGVKWFPLPWLGVRAQGQWLPTWFDPELKGFVCGGGCVVAFGGQLSHQAQVSFGPVFSF